jgi:membrane protein
MGAVVFLWRLAHRTFGLCMRYRVTGLAAEAGFFALMSLPPLVLGLIAGVGLVGRNLGNDVVLDLRMRISELAGSFLTPGAVSTVILPTFDEVLHGGRVEIMSMAFLLSLWSGSRALNVYVDTITIMYGLGGRRGIVRTRALSFSLYVGGMVLGMFLMPLVLMGPELLTDLLSSRLAGAPSLQWLGFFYWPAVVGLTVLGLTTLYHVATPLRSPWRRDLPGAVLALVIWVLSSFVLRIVIAASVGGASIYGPLATPIIVMMWLYFIAIAVLIGAALNAALDEFFPSPARNRLRAGDDTSDPALA